MEMPAIGIFIDSADSYFITRTIEDLIDACDEHRLHPVFYFGGSLEKGKTAGPYSYVYTLPDPQQISALIVLPNTLSPWDPKATIEILRPQFPQIPIYSFFENIPDCYNVWTDETDAIEDMILHILDGHAIRHFAFVMGPDSQNSISRERLNAIRNILSPRQITIDPENIFPGNFLEEDGKNAAQKILSRDKAAPEVLVCMNDQMAIGAIKEFLNNGIAVPEDIAVVGFDNIEDNATVKCSYTSVNFPIWELASAIVERIASDLAGKTSYAPESIAIKAQFQHRESCGCTSWFEKDARVDNTFIPLELHHSSHGTLKRAAILRKTIEDVIEESLASNDAAAFADFISQAIQVLSQSGDLSNIFVDLFSSQWTVALIRHPDHDTQIFLNALFIDAFRLLMLKRTDFFTKRRAHDLGALRFYQAINEKIGKKMTVYHALKLIGSNLPQLGVKRCIIVFLQNDNPDTGEIRLSYQEDQYTSVPETDFITLPCKRLVDKGISSFSGPMGVLPIAHHNSVYGYILLSITDKQYSLFSMIQRMVSQLVDSAMTNEMLSSHIQNLTQRNDILSRLSIVDEFTGLCNRRALYVTGRNLYQKTLEERQTSCFIFLDMDGLKAINDTYGHKDGDSAILALANILKRSFRENDLVVRYGGDEFIVLMINIQEETLHKALGRITANIEEFNGKEIYPWTLSVSWGFVFTAADAAPKSFESIIEESDALLYQEKRKKKGTQTQ